MSLYRAEEKNQNKVNKASLVAILTGTLDVVLTSNGLDKSFCFEGNPFYNFLYQEIGVEGLALGKTLLLSEILLICQRYKNTFFINSASLMNSVGIASGIASQIIGRYS